MLSAMADSHIEDAARVAVDPAAPEAERHQARAEFGKWRSKQSAGVLEVLEHLSPQTDKERLPIQVGRRHFHSWKDTESLYAEVTAWTVFEPDHICPTDTPPPLTQIAFEEVFGDYIRERGAILRLHPLYKRWTIFAKEPGPEGMRYRPVIVCVNSDGQYGKVPTDLQDSVDKRLHPLLANLAIGSYKEPTRQDFENLRNLADRRRLDKDLRSRTKRFAREELAATEAGRAQLYDMVDDFVSWNGSLLARDINRKHGSMQGLPFVPQTSLDEFNRLHPMYEEEFARDPDTGKQLTYKVIRRLKPFERGDFLGPVQMRMAALVAYGDYWQAAVAEAEKQMESEDPETQQAARLTHMRLGFLDPALSDAELEALVADANATMPGMVEALFGERGPRGIFDEEVAQAQKNIEEAIKLQSWEESNKWRVANHLPLKPCPVEVPELEGLDLLQDPAAPIPASREEKIKEAAWQSRVQQLARLKS